MKKFSKIAQCLLGVCGLAGMVYAEDLPWTGWYVGGQAGFVFNNTQLTAQHLGFVSPSASYSMNASTLTVAPGLQVGYLHRFSNVWVAGVEANVTMDTHQNDAFTENSEFRPAVHDRFTLTHSIQTSLKGRLGHTVDLYKHHFLPYVTAGLSFARLGLSYQNELGETYSNTTLEQGWLVGSGIEWTVTPHWSVRGEYDFVSYHAINLVIPTIYDLNDPSGNAKAALTTQSVVVAINYWP